MNAVDSNSNDPISDLLKSFDPAEVQAALSKLVAASIGDPVIAFSHSAARKYHSLTDIEWTAMSPTEGRLILRCDDVRFAGDECWGSKL